MNEKPSFTKVSEGETGWHRPEKGPCKFLPPNGEREFARVFLWEKNMNERKQIIDIAKNIEQAFAKNKPILLGEIGSGRPVLSVTTGMHGNEHVGVDVIRELRDTARIQKGTLRLIIANPPALAQGVRYIYTDLNRVYPGEEGAIGEAGLAPQILQLVSDSDLTLDIHTTNSPSESFVILGRKSEDRLKFAEQLGISKIVLFESERSCAMADFVKCGIGVELGEHGSEYAYEQGRFVVQQVLCSLGMTQGAPVKVEHEYFEILGSLPRSDGVTSVSPLIRNFQSVSMGQILAYKDGKEDSYVFAQEDFYPVLFGERSYGSFLGYKAKRITREGLIGGIHDR